MDNETRAVAKEKADAMNERIGYPEILTNVVELEKEYVHVNVHLKKHTLDRNTLTQGLIFFIFSTAHN